MKNTSILYDFNGLEHSFTIEIKNVDYKDIIIVFPNINASTKEVFSSINLDNIDKNESIYFENRIKFENWYLLVGPCSGFERNHQS